MVQQLHCGFDIHLLAYSFPFRLKLSSNYIVALKFSFLFASFLLEFVSSTLNGEAVTFSLQRSASY